MDPRSEEKKKRLESLLDCGVAMVHLDARAPGVSVPPQFREDHHLRLNLSRRFDPFDLTLSDWGVRQTLSFSRTPYLIAVPWSAIFAVTPAHGEGEVWLFPEALPPEVLDAAAKRWGFSEDEIAQLRNGARESPPIGLGPNEVEAAIDEIEKRPFVPRVVEDAPAPAPEPAKPEGDEPPTPPNGPRRGHLRVVK